MPVTLPGTNKTLGQCIYRSRPSSKYQGKAQLLYRNVFLRHAQLHKLCVKVSIVQSRGERLCLVGRKDGILVCKCLPKDGLMKLIVPKYEIKRGRGLRLLTMHESCSSNYGSGRLGLVMHGFPVRT
jgi:hypothetical protein